MSIKKSFRIEDEEEYKQFKLQCLERGTTPEREIVQFIESQINNKNKLNEEDVKTKSRLIDNLSIYILQNYDVSKWRPNSNITIKLDQQEHLNLIRFCGFKSDEAVKQAVKMAISSYWLKYIAQRRIESLSEEELQSRLEQVASAEKTTKTLVEQEVFKLSVSEKLKGLERFDNMNVNFTVSESILKSKPLSEMQISDLGQIIAFNCTIIGFDPKGITDDDEKKKYYIQNITVQEPEDEAKNNTPSINHCIVYGRYAGDIAIGQRRRIIALYSTLPSKRNDVEIPVFYAIQLSDLQNEKETKLTHTQLENAVNWAKSDESSYIQGLLDNFAPHIHNRDLEKFFILLSIIGGSNLGEYRKESHMLMVGEPSTGKSELLKFVNRITDKSAIVDGPNSSISGLLFGLEDWDRGKILKAGTLILNNGGVVCIDEYDKMDWNVRKALNTTMEQQKATYHKIQNSTAEVKTTIIASANPHRDRWVESKDIIDNLKPLDISAITRFDIIMRLSNQRDSNSARNMIKHIFKHTDGHYEIKLDDQIFKGLINYVKKRNPKISEKAQKQIENFYVEFSSLEQEDNTLPIEPRQAIGILRLCTAYAKLTFRNEVDEDCVNTVIEKFKESLSTLGLKTDNGIHQMNLAGKKINRDEAFDDIIRELEDKSEDGTFTEFDVLQSMIESEHWKTPEACRSYWEKHYRARKFYEPKAGRYKRV